MELQFTKMEGCGNDYVYIDCFNQYIADASALARAVSDRHRGIGGDGMILICPSTVADGRMRMYNQDGSEGKMCGNGVRCVGKYLYDSGIARRNLITVETETGVKTLAVIQQDGEATALSVNMGRPALRAAEIPVRMDGERVVNRPLAISGETYHVTCVSMGNPHCVVFVEDPAALDLPAIGPLFEAAPVFPQGVNTEFVRVLGPRTLCMRVWERGSGETLACGTGACAAVVAAVENGLCPKGEEVTVMLPGGELVICYTRDSVFMTGPARRIFSGVWHVDA